MVARTTVLRRVLAPVLLALACAALGAPTAAGDRLGFTLVVLQDFGASDMHLLRDSREAELRAQLPFEVGAFRAASPDLGPSLAGLLSGKFPAELGLHRSRGADGRGAQAAPAETFRAMQLLLASGVRVGHFGLWPFSRALDGELASAWLVSDDFSATVAAARAFVAALPSEADFFVNVWLPRLDATTDFGGNFTDADWPAGFSGVAERKDGGGECPDTFRGDDGEYEARYSSCPRHMYRANRDHEVEALLPLLRDARQVLGASGCSVVALTGSNGPESEHADAHARGLSAFRGRKRSLYDGGLRVPLLFATDGWPAAQQPVVKDLAAAQLHGADVLPTALGVLGLTAAAAEAWGEHALDGADASACVLGGGACAAALQLPRHKAQMWEWRFSVPGHCMHEAPRFAVVMGDYKLLLESDAESVDATRAPELFDLSLAPFEKPNLFNGSLASAASQTRLETVKQVMQTELRAWIAHLRAFAPSTPSYNDAALQPTPHAGCAGRGGGLLLAGSPSADGAALPLPAASQAARRERLQGIIVILADDMGAGDMSAYVGDAEHGDLDMNVAFEPRTRDFDALAAQGALWTHFYASAAVCSPSRASLMTGRRPSHKHVAFHNIVDKSASNNARRGVPDFLGEGVDFATKLTTLPRFFKDRGFVTGHFGKWHMGYESTGDYDTGGALYGLDEYMVYGVNADKMVRNVQFPTASQRHDNFLDNADFLFSSYAQSALVNRTLEFVADRVAAQENFFVNLWVQNPHAPLNVALSYDQPAANGFPSAANPMPNSGPNAQARLKASAETNVPLQVYRTLLRDQERQIARLVASVDAMGAGDRTLFVYTADNGPEDRTVNFVTVGSADPFRGRKRSMYEGGLRVPLWMRWPGAIPAGRVVSQPASLADLLPTLAGMAGHQAELAALPDASQIMSYSQDLSCLALGGGGVGGFDCAPQCADVACAQRMLGDRPLYFEFRDVAVGDCLNTAPRIALRRGRYKLLWEPVQKNNMYPTAKSGVLRMELYDLAVDPTEFDDLLLTQAGSAQVAAVAAQLLAEAAAYIASPQYDKVFKPKNAANALRYDQTFAEFFAGEECVPKGTNPQPGSGAPAALAVSAAAADAVSCSVVYLCPGAPSVATPRPSYPDAPPAPTRSPSRSPVPAPAPAPAPVSVPGTPSGGGGGTPAPGPSAGGTSAPGSGSTPAPSSEEARAPSGAAATHVSLGLVLLLLRSMVL